MTEPYPTAVPDARVPDVARPVLEAPVNRLSVAALIAAFLLPLVGIVVGHLALRQIAQTGERGRSVAVAATALAYLITFGATIGIVAYLASLTGVLAS